MNVQFYLRGQTPEFDRKDRQAKEEPEVTNPPKPPRLEKQYQRKQNPPGKSNTTWLTNQSQVFKITYWLNTKDRYHHSLKQSNL
ncbi:hypothetical protein ACTXT7_001718 [Hymenolepis weldensis]